MSGLLVNVVVVLIFILIGGFFAAVELALVSIRESQAERLAADHPSSGGRVLRLTRDPNRFLAAVQVGVTVAGFLSAGFGAAQIAPLIAPAFAALGLGPGWSQSIAFILVTMTIAYLSLVLGELVPKRLALQRSEAVALRTAGPVDWLSGITRPFIWLLSRSTDLVVRLVGGDPNAGRERLSQEELRGLVQSHDELTQTERDLIDEVFAAGERELREVMVPRTEVEFLQRSLPVSEAATHVGRLPHSRYPVIGSSADDVVGFVHVRDILDPAVAGRPLRVGALAREVVRLPGSKRVLPALNEMRAGGHHLAIVADEYGGTDGIVTMEDLVEELVGDIWDEYDAAGSAHSEKSEGMLSRTHEIAGLMNLEDFAEAFGVSLPEGPYETVAGFVISGLGRLPREGDTVVTPHCMLTVVAMDGRRIERLTISPLNDAGASPDPA